MKPYIWTHSEIDGDGIENIGVMLEEPKVNERNLCEGGMFLSFSIDHAKQRTECWAGTFHNGCPALTIGRKTWGEEILIEKECLKFAEEYDSNVTYE